MFMVVAAPTASTVDRLLTLLPQLRSGVKGSFLVKEDMSSGQRTVQRTLACIQRKSMDVSFVVSRSRQGARLGLMVMLLSAVVVRL